jgi:hypothetical protein
MQPKPMAQMMSPQGMQSRIADKYLQIGTGCRIRFKNCGDVLAGGAEKTDHGEFSALSSQFSVLRSADRTSFGDLSETAELRIVFLFHP